MDFQILGIIIIGIFLGFFVQTVIGFAGSLIALPILLLALELPDAIAYTSIFYLFSSAFLVTKEWRNMDRKILLKLTLASIVGVLLGIAVLAFGQPAILKKALGVFILFYVGYTFIDKSNLNPRNRTEWLFGMLGGFFSGVFSTGGPLYVMSVKNSVPDVKTFRATMIGVLALVTIVRVPALSFSGILNLSHLKMTVFVLPFFLLAQFLGKRCFLKIDEHLFKKILLVLLTISGVLLIV